MDDDKRDAERYRWLRQTDPTTLCCIAWRVRQACQFNQVDEAVDAAIAGSAPQKEGSHG